MTSPHAPVLLAEVLEALNPQPGDVVIDATFGAGGYARALLAQGATDFAQGYQWRELALKQEALYFSVLAERPAQT